MSESPEQQFDLLCNSLTPDMRHHLHQWDEFRWLDPYALHSLARNGYRELMQHPDLFVFIRGMYDDEDTFSSQKDFEAIFAAQTAFRKAWIETVSTTLENLSQPAEWTDQIFCIVAQERITSRAYLEARLQISQATLSRSIQILRDQKLVSEQPVSLGPGRPVKAISLTQQGLAHAHAHGIQASPAPEAQSSAIAERFFHQHIATIFFKADPSINIKRAYTEDLFTIQTPLGTIYPDMVVHHANGTIQYIEAESGTYEYKRLRDKLDKYLASPADEVLIVTETQRGPTSSHVRQWLHDRNTHPLDGIPPKSHLNIRITSIDQLQRSGPNENIWQVFRYGPQTDRPAPMEAPRQVSQLREQLRQWEKVLGEEDFYPQYCSAGEPFVLQDKDGHEKARLQADIVLLEMESSICQVYLEQSADWSAERIQEFLNETDKFLKASCLLYKDRRIYPRFHWMYGVIYLVHTSSEASNPDQLASIYDRWRQSSLRYQLLHGYPIFIRVIHLDEMQGKTYLDVPEFAYDLTGMF